MSQIFKPLDELFEERKEIVAGNQVRVTGPLAEVFCKTLNEEYAHDKGKIEKMRGDLGIEGVAVDAVRDILYRVTTSGDDGVSIHVQEADTLDEESVRAITSRSSLMGDKFSLVLVEGDQNESNIVTRNMSTIAKQDYKRLVEDVLLENKSAVYRGSFV